MTQRLTLRKVNKVFLIIAVKSFEKLLFMSGHRIMTFVFLTFYI